jgi:anti-sigma B factor antagonist
MGVTPTQPQSGQYFQVERHGDIVVIVPSSEVEDMSEDAIRQAATMVLSPIRQDPPAGLIVDLEQVKFFGSNFISFLLRCHLLIKERGNELVLAGVQPRIRELLRTTNLDTLWALYDSRAEAIEAIGGSD